MINVETTRSEVDADSLPALIPDTSPRYHLFCFKHTHEGDYQEAKGELGHYYCGDYKEATVGGEGS